MAGKLLLLLGLGAGALMLSSGTAHAESGGGGSGGGKPEPHPQGFDVNNPPADVLKLIATAAQSANPALMRSTADHLDELGYKPQAAALRTAAAAIEAAQGALPKPGNATPPGPIVVPGPPGTPAITLPPLVMPSGTPSGADPLAANLTAKLNLTDPIAHGRTNANAQKDLVTKFQAQEKTRGNYTGSLDGLYGPGVALAVAGYNIVPYPPFFWSSNKNKTAGWKASFKAAMLKKAAADPTRADEWSHVALAAQNT